MRPHTVLHTFEMSHSHSPSRNANFKFISGLFSSGARRPAGTLCMLAAELRSGEHSGHFAHTALRLRNELK